MTFKKAEMAKTLRNGLSMIETNPLSHNWLDFAILSGLTLHQFQKKLLLNGWSLRPSLFTKKYVHTTVLSQNLLYIFHIKDMYI